MLHASCFYLRFEMDTGECYKFSDGENKCLDSGKGGQFCHLSEDSDWSKYGEGTSAKEINGDSGMDSMVPESFLGEREIVSAFSEGSRSHQDHMLDICSSAVAFKGEVNCGKQRSVTFSSEIKVYLIPYEDRRSEWMQIAADRFRFERRVRQFKELFCGTIWLVCLRGCWYLYYLCFKKE